MLQAVQFSITLLWAPTASRGHLDLKGQHYHQIRVFVVWEILSHSFGKVAGRFSWYQALWEPPPQHPKAGGTLQEPPPQHLRLQSPSAAPQAQELRWGSLGAPLPIPQEA